MSLSDSIGRITRNEQGGVAGVTLIDNARQGYPTGGKYFEMRTDRGILGIDFVKRTQRGELATGINSNLFSLYN
jgi:hypothetical protein